MSVTVPGPDGRSRCGWCAAASEFFDYLDKEWGFPVAHDIRLFKKLCLESFQSGLSWRAILNKRDNFRTAFQGFDFRKMALFDEADVARLLSDAGIVRYRGKIEAMINSALCLRPSGRRKVFSCIYLAFRTSGRDSSSTKPLDFPHVGGSFKRAA